MKRVHYRVLSVILAAAMSLSLLSVGALADELPVDLLQSVLDATETAQEDTEVLMEESEEAVFEDVAEEIPEEEERVLTAAVENTAETLAVSYPAAYPLPALTGNQALDVANIAKSQLGYAWDGGTEYCAWWSDVTGIDFTASQGWCSVFACWCAHKAGAGLWKAFNYNGGSPTLLLDWYMDNAVVDFAHTTEPMPGDFLFFGYSTSYVTHVAIVVEYDPDTDIITFVGGNQQDGRVTTMTISWDPDFVADNGRRLLCYGRPNYDTSYTVSFDANGGSCGTNRVTCVPGSAIGTLPVPTRGGYTFEGWYTAAEGGTLVMANTVVNGNMTVYAHWAAVSCTMTPSSELVTVDLRVTDSAELGLTFAGNLPADYAISVVLSADNVTTAWKSRKASEAVLRITALSAGYCDIILSYVDSSTGKTLDTLVVTVLVPGESGVCGDDLRWMADADGGLFIEGRGPMWDYISDWPSYDTLSQEITSVKIEGATAVGAYAFFYFRNLREVHLSDSVTAVGERAFGECPSLTDVYFAGTPEQWEQLKETAGAGNEALFAATVHYTGTNHDGVITAADVVQLMKYIVGAVTELDEAAHDPNGDTVTDIQDVVRLVRYLAGEDVELK